MPLVTYHLSLEFLLKFFAKKVFILSNKKNFSKYQKRIKTFETTDI